jgi:hypothetical protein
MVSKSELKMDLRKKYKEIFSRERSLAQTVSHVMIKARSISVWEFLIPILLIFNFAKSKEIKEIFIQNFLFTKELALKGAQDMKNEGVSRRETLSRIEQKTQKLLESIKENIYSEEVRKKQMEEINLLLDHYSRLFEAEGKDYKAWLTHAYENPESYMAFLDSLKKAEKEVYLAAMKTVGSQRNTEMVVKMEGTTERVRVAAAEKIFKSFPCQ